MLGVAATDGTHTASADGTIDIYVLTPEVLMECAVATPGNMDTDAELLAILNDRVAFDLSASTYTLDEDQGDASTNGLRIVSGDIGAGTVKFRLLSGSSDQ
jgi:hypothetical protein